MLKAIVVDDFKGDQWQLVPCCVWKIALHGQWYSWWRVMTGPQEITKWYEIIPIPCFTEWWT